MTDVATKTVERKWGWVIAPVAIFLAIAALFAFALKTGDPSKLPSALLGKAAPQIDLQPLEGLVAPDGKPVPGFKTADLGHGKVAIVNFWASWCVPCVQEHPVLVDLQKRTGVDVYGVNYKDQTEAARRFIGRYGNPFTAVGVDANGRGAIEWGVYGMPESFIVDPQGRIAYKHVGPMTPEIVAEKIIPEIEKAKKAATVK